MAFDGVTETEIAKAAAKPPAPESEISPVLLDDSRYDGDPAPINLGLSTNRQQQTPAPDSSLAAFAVRLGLPDLARAARGALRSVQSKFMDFSSNPALTNGLVFDPERAANALAVACNETKGQCLHYVADALSAAGLNIRADLPVHHDGEHWAKDASAALQKDSRFDIVTVGYGAHIDSDYHAQKGDIVVWEGGKNGHIMLCVGERQDKSPIWRCDFTAKEDNWTGLKDPASHGSFKIFRQHSLNASPALQVAIATPAAEHGPRVSSGPHHTVAKHHLS